jgi:hypothetical protein
LLRVGNIEDVHAFIEVSTEQLSGLVRSEVMTFAEKFEELGRKEGRQEGRQEVALSMLKEGVDTAFVVKTTCLSLTDIERLTESLSVPTT